MHPSTLRAWTDQGRLRCLRINERGDRRYRAEDLEGFLRTADPGQARLQPQGEATPGPGDIPAPLSAAADPVADGRLALLAELSRLCASTGDPDAALRAVAATLRRGGRFETVAICEVTPSGMQTHVVDASARRRSSGFELDARLAGVCLRDGRPIAVPRTRPSSGASGRWRPPIGSAAVEISVPVSTSGRAWGVLVVESPAERPIDRDDLDLLRAVGSQLAMAMGWGRMEARLQSIQQLGTRLTRLTTVSGIGQAIATELKQLIDYHNVRVYRVHDQEVVPVAWRGEMGEYTDENDYQLRLIVGEGITGWVALHGQAQYLPDAAIDPRSQTIVGTEDDLDESMLLAPMLYEDRVIGVIVLSKLGLDQFAGSDSVRLLEIYASLAAQAMINADATEQLQAQSARLERQVASQQELMRATEAILSKLDPRAVMESIADRLGTLVHVDNLIISVHDPDQRRLNPIFARGVSAEHFSESRLSDAEGVAGWVLQHGEAQSVPDKLSDPRVSHHDVRGPQAGALIVAPLRARDRVTGLLTLERLGPDAAFTEDEFELIQLFSGHVSIALQNARAHRAVEIRAETDALTGLKNHGTFVDHLEMAIERGMPFGLLLVDLDDFKAFNDRCGHEAGNRLLAGIAAALRSSSRETDEVFRYGGDEFALVLPGADMAGSLAVAEKVRRAVGSVPIPGSRRRSGVTCSIGLGSFPEDGRVRSSLMLAADRACYLAKHRGRDGIVTAAMTELAGTAEAALLSGLLPDQPLVETLIA